MTAEDHIIAWIESSRPHYDELRALETFRKSSTTNLWMRKRQPITVMGLASSLVTRAYAEMLSSGDASSDDIYSPADLAKAVMLVVAWELEQ